MCHSECLLGYRQNVPRNKNGQCPRYLPSNSQPQKQNASRVAQWDVYIVMAKINPTYS